MLMGFQNSGSRSNQREAIEVVGKYSDRLLQEDGEDGVLGIRIVRWWMPDFQQRSASALTKFHPPLRCLGRLDRSGITCVLESMAKEGRIEWKDSMRDSFFIFAQSLNEIANAVYDWARRSAKIGKIETLKWISSGDDTMKTESTYAGASMTICLRVL